MNAIITSWLLLALVSVATAQPYTYPAGSAETQIKALCRQAGFSVVWDKGLLNDARTQAVSESDADTALAKMLARTGLAFVHTSARYIAIFRPVVTVCVRNICAVAPPSAD